MDFNYRLRLFYCKQGMHSFVNKARHQVPRVDGTAVVKHAWLWQQAGMECKSSRVQSLLELAGAC